MKFSPYWIIFIIAAIFILHFWILAQQKRDLYFHYPIISEPSSSARLEVELREQKDKNSLIKIYAFFILILIWQGIWNPTHQFQVDSLEADKQHTAYVREYNTGWDDQCGAIFSRIASSSEVIYGQTLKLSYATCTNLKPTSGAEDSFSKYIGGFIRESSEFEMGVKGRQRANSDALDSIFSLSDYWCWSNECVTVKNFDVTK